MNNSRNSVVPPKVLRLNWRGTRTGWLAYDPTIKYLTRVPRPASATVRRAHNHSQLVLHHAVQHLKVKHIVVCGHYGCGGVGAAMQSTDMGSLNNWLREVRDVYRPHATELNAIEDETARYKRLVELNVREQVINVIKSAVVQKSYREGSFPVVHGWFTI